MKLSVQFWFDQLFNFVLKTKDVMALSTSGNCMKYTLFVLNFVFVVSQLLQSFCKSIDLLIDCALVDNWNSSFISWTDSARNLSWIHRVSRLTILHTAHIFNRHRVYNILHCFLWMLRCDEGKLLHDIDGEP